MDRRLTQLQWDFLEQHIKAKKHDYYRTNKVKLKGKFLEADGDMTSADVLIDAWVVEEVLHGELGERPYQCQCGRRVRHLYVVKHRSKEVTLKLGSTCYKDYIGIGAETFVQVSTYHQTLVAEREEIIERHDIGDLELMKFLLDYEALKTLYRQQLLLGLPLSYAQESKAYKDLGIEDEDSLVTVKESIRQLNKRQLGRLNALTPQGRMTLVGRLRDGRILGVLDEVLQAAPELFADRGIPQEFAPNRLERRLIKRFEAEGVNGDWRQDPLFVEDIDKLLSLVKSEVIEPQVLVKIGMSLLTQRQREYWGGHTSFRQKVELTEHLLKETNRVEVRADMSIPIKFRQQVDCGLPLTNRQMTQLKAL